MQVTVQCCPKDKNIYSVCHFRPKTHLPLPLVY